MNCLNVLDGTDPQAACQVRMAVYEEQIEMCKAYIANHPEHEEYYNSVISHLVSWIENCKIRLLQLAEVKDAVQ